MLFSIMASPHLERPIIKKKKTKIRISAGIKRPRYQGKANLSLRRRGATGRDATRGRQSLQHRRGRSVRIRQAGIARRGRRVDGRTVGLAAVPEDLLDVAELQDHGDQRIGVGGH